MSGALHPKPCGPMQLGGKEAMSAAGKEWSQLSAVEKGRYKA